MICHCSASKYSCLAQHLLFATFHDLFAFAICSSLLVVARSVTEMTTRMCVAVCYTAHRVQKGPLHWYCCRSICRVDVISLLPAESVGAQVPTSRIPMLWDGDHRLHAMVGFTPRVIYKLCPGMLLRRVTLLILAAVYPALTLVER